MKIRFKDSNMNKVYHTYVSLPKDTVDIAMERSSSGSNRDMAFKIGYRGLKNMFPTNCLLYAIYVAGKEYVKFNTKTLLEIIDTTNPKGSGAKPKYNEETKTIAFRCPISKIDELKLIINSKLSEYQITSFRNDCQ